MGSISDNLKIWDDQYNWGNLGDEWSEPWGSVKAQWFFTLFPRIQSFVPAKTILEIGPGFGRWTQFLSGLCENLILVDVTPKCIEACKQRFQSQKHISYHVNDGKSLDMIPDESVDFVFSFDSLVHAESNVFQDYLVQLKRKLTPGGAAWIHHSNLAEYQTYFSFLKKIPPKIKSRLAKNLGWIEYDHHWRAPSMSAKIFRHFAEEAGFSYVGQELINWWDTRRLIDCISIVKKQPLTQEKSFTFRNGNFAAEAKYVKTLSQFHCLENSAKKT